MPRNVAFQRGSVGKASLAQCTFVGTITSVGPHVNLEPTLVTEIGGTKSAFIGTLSGMNAHVINQGVTLRERGGTDSAPIWTFARMNAPVTYQIGTHGERLRAQVT